MEKDQKNVQESSIKNQYLTALVVNLLTITYGVSIGWTSPSILLLSSDETPLPSGKMTTQELSWIASLLGLGGLFGNIFFGFISNAYGRKIPLILNAIPAIISWLLISYAQNVYYLYAARLMSGFMGGGVYVVTPLFLTEIASDRVRGVLGSTLVLSCNVGVLTAFILGNYCDFYTTPKFVIALTTLFALLFTYFPESPMSLMKQNRLLEMEQSIRFYRNIQGRAQDQEILRFEMDKLKKSIGGSNLEKNDEKCNENTWNWSDFITGTGKKAMTIGIVLAVLNQFCGCFAMLYYTAHIFKEAGSNLSPNLAAIIVGVIQIIGSYMATFLVDRAGRKFLFAVSAIGTALGFIILGVFMMLKSWNIEMDAFTWVPVASFSFILFIASWAILTLPILVISEVMPENLKDFGLSFCTTLVWLFAFISLKLLPIQIELMGFHGTMFLYAGVCLSSVIYIIKCIPETKGKSYEQIMNSLK